MIAGRGITHSERLERARAQGDHLHGIQAWVALPKEQEEIAPSFSPSIPESSCRNGTRQGLSVS